ncbi:hypothetical protein RJT34_32461 [Clitoria ternatea]|uniref:Uncharacterized protein n=1 Tax=Clitoria ternatea TaxID=43366 RepID=A0AAN9I2B6_CLITE
MDRMVLKGPIEENGDFECSKMLRRKPTKIEVKIEDKEELEEARRRNATAATTAGAATLLRQFDRAQDPSSKAHRIGLSS